MNTRLLGLTVLSCALALSACSAAVPTPAAPEVSESINATEKGGSREEKVTVYATVEKVDQKKRIVTVIGFDGAKQVIEAGPEVRNLAQVKKGDQIILTYLQSVAFEVIAPGDKRSEATAAEGTGRAEVGEKPGAMDLRMVTVVADVVKLDRKNSTATLRGPEGETTVVDIKSPAVFDRVKVGDRVEITMTAALAIDVQSAPAK